MQRRGMARELSLGPLPRWQLLCVSASISRAWAYKQCATVLCFPLTKDGSDCLQNILLIRILHHHLSFIDICSKKYIWPQVRPSSISFTCVFALTVDKGAQWSLLKFILSNYTTQDSVLDRIHPGTHRETSIDFYWSNIHLFKGALSSAQNLLVFQLKEVSTTKRCRFCVPGLLAMGHSDAWYCMATNKWLFTD